MASKVRLYELKQKGYCCSQIIMKAGLEDAGKEDNPDLVQAMSGLCDGLRTGMVCGVLSGAACLLALLEPEDSPVLIKDLTEWFRGEFEEKNGGITCEDILAGDQLNRTIKCPKILTETYNMAMEILEANGYEFPDSYVPG
ncbi:MAG: C_GCAxxG_C_C family protein [Peptococcaceae bacterium]|jgi:C_GCAxxG_C_C family probable redox protein|nr:C_GCAxxG_C_C family protein [Peptococcaceae bacterium]